MKKRFVKAIITFQLNESYDEMPTEDILPHFGARMKFNYLCGTNETTMEMSVVEVDTIQTSPIGS